MQERKVGSLVEWGTLRRKAFISRVEKRMKNERTNGRGAWIMVRFKFTWPTFQEFAPLNFIYSVRSSSASVFLFSRACCSLTESVPFVAQPSDEGCLMQKNKVRENTHTS